MQAMPGSKENLLGLLHNSVDLYDSETETIIDAATQVAAC